MALQDAGFQLVLNALKDEGTQVRLYGSDGSADTFSDYLSIVWNNPGDQSGTWRLVSSATSPVTWSIDQDFLDSTSNGYFGVVGIELADSQNTVLLKKAFSQTYTFDVPGEFTLEQLIVEAS